MSIPLITDVVPALGSTPSGGIAIAFSLTLLGGLAIGKLRSMLRSREADRKEASPPELPRELLLPVVHRDPDHIARAEIVACISELILAGDWKKVSAQIAIWESKLEATPAGTRYHDVAIDTCLAALQNLIDEAPRDKLEDLAATEVALSQMVERHRESPKNHILAVIAARAHMVVAETCSAEYWPETERHAAWRQMAHHFLAAEGILDAFEPVEYMSPLLGGTVYRMSLGMPDASVRLRPAFEDWIDLDPSDPTIYACHAHALIPEHYGTIPEILREADRAEERTRETLGQGGYALFAVPLLNLDETLREQFSPERLAGGLMDLAQLSGTQAEVNWAASCLAKESAHGSAQRRKVMLSAFDAIVRRHLGVIYPRLWDIPLDEIRSKLKGVFENTPEAEETGASIPPEETSRAAA